MPDQTRGEASGAGESPDAVPKSGRGGHTGPQHGFVSRLSDVTDEPTTGNRQEEVDSNSPDGEPSRDPQEEHDSASVVQDEAEETSEDTGPCRTDQGNWDPLSAAVPLIRVRLLQSVKLLPCQSLSVLVKTHAGEHKGPLLIEYDEAVEKATGLHVQDAMFTPQDGVAPLVVSNPSGFTQAVGEGEELGKVMQVTVVQPEEVEEMGEVTGVQVVQPEVASDANTFRVSVDEDRCQKIREMVELTGITEVERSKQLKLLEEHNAAFSLKDGECGETDLVDMERDTRDAKPKR